MINPKDMGSLATTEKRQCVQQWPQLTSSWFLLDDVRRSRKSCRRKGGKHPECVRERKTETEERVTSGRQEKKGHKERKGKKR